LQADYFALCGDAGRLWRRTVAAGGGWDNALPAAALFCKLIATAVPNMRLGGRRALPAGYASQQNSTRTSTFVCYTWRLLAAGVMDLRLLLWLSMARAPGSRCSVYVVCSGDFVEMRLHIMLRQLERLFAVAFRMDAIERKGGMKTLLAWRTDCIAGAENAEKTGIESSLSPVYVPYLLLRGTDIDSGRRKAVLADDANGQQSQRAADGEDNGVASGFVSRFYGSV